MLVWSSKSKVRASAGDMARPAYIRGSLPAPMRIIERMPCFLSASSSSLTVLHSTR